MDAKIEERIIELRSQGESYEDIARRLNISRNELLEWTRQRQQLVKQRGCGCC